MTPPLAELVALTTLGLGLWAGWVVFRSVIATEIRLVVASLVVVAVAYTVQRRRRDIVSYSVLLVGVAVSSIACAVAVRDATGADHNGPIVLGTLGAGAIGYLMAGRTTRPRRCDATNYAVLFGSTIGLLGVFMLPDGWRFAAAIGAFVTGAAALATKPVPNSAIVASTVNWALAALFIVG